MIENEHNTRPHLDRESRYREVLGGTHAVSALGLLFLEVVMRKRDSVDLAILGTLKGVMAHYGAGYCFPSQQKLLTLMKKYHGVTISRATLNRRLKILEGDGFINRTRRITKLRTGNYRFLSTLYKVGQNLYKYAAGLAKQANQLLTNPRVSLKLHYPITLVRSTIKTDTRKTLERPLKLGAIMEKILGGKGLLV